MSRRDRFENALIATYLGLVGVTLVIAAVGLACGGAL